MAEPNPKTVLNTFCQRILKKVIGKEDVVYTTELVGNDQYQCIVSLVGLGEEFSGDIAESAKAAEQSAAAAALEHHVDDVTALQPANPKKPKKQQLLPQQLVPQQRQQVQLPVPQQLWQVRLPQQQHQQRQNGLIKTPGVTTSPGVVAAMKAVNQSYKMTLNVALGRILRRPLTKGEIVCDTLDVGAGFQTTLTMPTVPGEIGEMAWAGEVGATLREAEELACSQALVSLEADPEYRSIISTPAAKPSQEERHLGRSGDAAAATLVPSRAVGAAPRPTGAFAPVPSIAVGKGGFKGAGKGALKGAGKGVLALGKGAVKGVANNFSKPLPPSGFPPAGLVRVAPVANKGAAKGVVKGLPAGMVKGALQAKGAAKGAVKGKAMVRQRISDDLITGVVAEWKGTFGWVQPEEQIVHPWSAKNRGRVFLHQKDVEGEYSPEAGSTVMFYPYADASGLGAEGVLLC